jgi:predicted aconitase
LVTDNNHGSPLTGSFSKLLTTILGKVVVPTTLNSMSVDQRQWKSLGVAPALGEPAAALGDAYLALGATHSFTCAPYLLDSAPSVGDQIAWVFENLNPRPP